MSKPFRERNPVIIGAISLTVLTALLLAGFRAQDLPIIGGGETYYATFSEAGGLEPQDEVRIAGVRVGQVTDVALEDGKVKATFKVKTDSAFGKDTGASIRVKTLLGDVFLALEPAGEGQLPTEAEIPVERTSSPYDVVEAFEGLADTSQRIDTDRLAKSLTTLADLTRNAPDEFRSALTGVSRLSETIASRDDQIRSLLTNLERVSTVLDDRDQDIVTLMEDADVLFRALVARREQIHNVLLATSTLSQELTVLVEQSRADLKPALQQVDGVLQVLNKNEDNLDNSLRLMAPFYRVFANTLGNGPWFDTYIQNIPPGPGPLGPAGRAADGGHAMTTLSKYIGPVIVLALVVAAAFTVLGEDDQKTITAYFPRAISVYEGSDVRVLGVPVGTVDTVEPKGTRVKVEISYDETVALPADAKAVIVAPSIVGDRFVQITPAYTGGDKLADGAEIDIDQTSVPLELDQIYSSINDLTVAVGPDGANSKGALTDLLEVTADNFRGQGETFNQTITDFATLTKTLDDSKEELFGSTAELEKFINTLANNDQTVRDFNSSLASVSTVLAGERQELAGALKNLATALTTVGDFVRTNREILTKDVAGLNRVANVLVKRRASIDEILNDAPVALNNLALTYNPQAGTLDTKSNLGENIEQITGNPTDFLCGIVNTNDPSGDTCDLIQGLPLPRTSPFGPGTGTSYGEPFDPSLGGLVAVRR